MATTMSDVARAAGVSVMTVSNVLNGKPRVSAATRQRILDLVDELGYEINLSARRLRSDRTGSIGLIVPRFDHPYFGELAAQLSRLLAATGRHLAVEQSDASKEAELAALSMARLQTYDGVILSVVGLDHDDIDRIRPSLPVVLLGEQNMPRRFDQIHMDNVEGARLATAHLLERGARHVVLAGGGDEGHASMMTLRTRGWRAAHEDRGAALPPAGILTLEEFEMDCARVRVRDRLRDDPSVDAVFAITDQVAVGAMAGIRDAGLRVPQDVQVVGFDNLALARHVTPALTTIDPENAWIVEQAVALLDRRIDDREKDPEHLVSPVRLVERGTTRPR
ncbi:LacI family DNA-binding transcriptional regulator [Isoptericola chiayiensis]|uniref:LacI family DNA-binding transcriptional regulator n=1 Tax=Isoptericola chiayiensis TaxID=579446 RepID=A0ABP8YLV8_9MICO|nr:LacI family DNA-binding transcriptional regulator [Isoptericola chiayiensis]NOW02370.1 DNA-binding LacI/PurR family transcriptional regulator [Isoptericola chiayiensis]